jgi:hypothetical protein
VNKVVWEREGERKLEKGGENFLIRSFVICIFHQIWHMGEYSNARFGLGSLRERGRLVDLGVHGSIILKSVIKK